MLTYSVTSDTMEGQFKDINTFSKPMSISVSSGHTAVAVTKTVNVSKANTINCWDKKLYHQLRCVVSGLGLENIS